MEYRQEQQARRSSSTPGSGLEAELTSIGFARLARGLLDVAASVGVADVSFRSPGRVGVGRAIRRNADGSATIAVRYRNRPAMSVAADMIEGIVRAAKKGSVHAGARDELWLAAGKILISASSSEVHGAAVDAADHPGLSTGGRRQSSAATPSATDPGFGSPGGGEIAGDMHASRPSPARRAA